MADEEEACVDKTKVILTGIFTCFPTWMGIFFIITKIYSLYDILQRNFKRKIVLSLKILKLEIRCSKYATLVNYGH